MKFLNMELKQLMASKQLATLSIFAGIIPLAHVIHACLYFRMQLFSLLFSNFKFYGNCLIDMGFQIFQTNTVFCATFAPFPRWRRILR